MNFTNFIQKHEIYNLPPRLNFDKIIMNVVYLKEAVKADRFLFCLGGE